MHSLPSYICICVYMFMFVFIYSTYIFLDPGYGDGGTFGMYICYLKVYVNELR